jgi:glycosyltransferase involved in cell wall biosynthesis
VVALVAGDGPERERLAALARALPGPHRAVLLGHVANVADVLCAADAFVLPSRAEGLGVAALEAMALGLPVVATRVGGLEQAVAQSGLLVPPDDAAALATAVASLAADGDLVRRLGSAARARIEAHFLFDVQVARYAALYERVLAGDDAPAAALGEP